MKKKISPVFFAFVTMLFSLMFCGIRTQAASLGQENWLTPGEKIISHDITNDGKKDTIRFRVTALGGGSDYCNKAYVYVNGTQALTLNIRACNSIQFRHISCSKKKNYLQIEAHADGGFMTMNKIYRYSKGKLTAAADLGRADNMSARITKVTSSYIEARFSVQPFETGRIEWSFKYKPSGSRLKLKSSTAPVVSALGDLTYPSDGYHKYFKKNQFVTSSGRTYYTSASLKKKAFTTKKGDIVTLKKVKISKKKMYLCFKKGKRTGWVRIKGSYTRNEWYRGVSQRLAG